MSEHQQLEDCIAGVVIPLEEKGVALISPEAIAAMVDDAIDPDSLSPSLKTYASMRQIKHHVRGYLRRRHDPEVKAKNDDPNLPLFSDELQPYYPVVISSEGEKKKTSYKLRHLLTVSEVQKIAKGMRRSGRTLLSHADALEAEAAERTRLRESKIQG